MIGGKLHLDAVCVQLQVAEIATGIIDKHIQGGRIWF
jgi:hypothetical protein